MNGIASVFLGPLQNLLNYLQKDRHHRDAQKDAALHAIEQAIIETERYLEKSGGQKCHDREQEFELSKLWSDASIKARHVSSEIAIRLNDKSSYWSDRFEWSADEVIGRGVDLASIRLQVRNLLSG